MKVKCIKGTSRILAGELYNAISLYNNPGDRGRVYIEGFSGFSVDNFTMPDGSPLPKIRYNPPRLTGIEPSNVKVDDIVICLSDRYTHLLRNGKYRVSEVRQKEYINRFSKQPYTKYFFKLEGSNRFIEILKYRFRFPNTSESRDIGINEIFDAAPDVSKVDTTTRKIENVSNRYSILTLALFKAATDKNRHKLDAIDWCCNQSSKSLKVKREDFSKLLELPLSEVLKLIDENNS